MRTYTDQDIQFIKDNYPHIATDEVARKLNKTISSIYNKAAALGVKKTAEFKRAMVNQGFIDAAKKSRFQKGHRPFNKGEKMPDKVYEKIKHTMFRPGHIPATCKHFGKPYLYDGKDGKTWWIHVDQKRLLYTSYLLDKHKIDRRDKVARFKDSFDHSRPPTLDDFDLISRSKNMELNSYHNNYPEDIARLIQLKGALNRQIKKIKSQ